MKILCNGNTQELQTNSNLIDLLALLGLDNKGLAIAVNDRIITKSLWENTLLQESDRVTLIRAAQGG